MAAFANDKSTVVVEDSEPLAPSESEARRFARSSDQIRRYPVFGSEIVHGLFTLTQCSKRVNRAATRYCQKTARRIVNFLSRCQQDQAGRGLPA